MLRVTVETGWEPHNKAVERLTTSYAAIPDGAPVRLAKRTTNLFRARAATSAPGLDVSGLGGVIEVDPEAGTADVQGMCTYEDLVDATLAHGMIPYVVPQLRTITLGGAVTGMGIEATSFRSGLPHESVLEMDILTGSGEVVTATPDNTHRELFETFPNSYGSLGYATRLKIKLEKVPGYVALRHIRFDDPGLLAKTIAQITEARTYDGIQVDAIDGVAFEPGECYLTLATWSETAAGATPSDYGGQQIYYRSIQQRAASGSGTDLLTIYDYLWRWDTDWFWCSGAFGAQNKYVRRLWPRRLRRSDVYMRLIGLDRKLGIADKLDARAGRPLRERVIQDVEVPVESLPAFLEWFDAEIGMRPVWLCPLVSQGTSGGGKWPTYPLEADQTYVNVGFWGTVHVGPDAVDAPRNRAIEARVHELGGHKSLYSEAFYDKDVFDALYDGDNLAAVKAMYDPGDRLTDLYSKAVKRL